jgi:hypothetical protein
VKWHQRSHNPPSCFRSFLILTINPRFLAFRSLSCEHSIIIYLRNDSTYIQRTITVENTYFSEMRIVMNQNQHAAPRSEYDPDKLLNAMLDKLKLKNDAALSRALEVAPPIISKIRHRRLPVAASILIRMHEVSNLPISELRELLGDRRAKFRISSVQGLPT